MDDEANQRWGDIPGYAIAAKTGTSSEPAHPGKPCPAQPAVRPRLELHRHGAGQRPAGRRRGERAEPKTKTDYFGDMVAGPVFYR